MFCWLIIYFVSFYFQMSIQQQHNSIQLYIPIPEIGIYVVEKTTKERKSYKK